MRLTLGLTRAPLTANVRLIPGHAALATHTQRYPAAQTGPPPTSTRLRMPNTETTRRPPRTHRAGIGIGISMKKKKSSADDDVELIKAVAQAWYAHSGNPRRDVADDDGAGRGVGARRAAGYRPSRFKLEAAAAAQSSSNRRSWDFAQSLWDTYELVTVAKKIESSLAIIDQATASSPLPRPGAARGAGGGGKWARESRRSLKSLFLRSSSRRFEESS